jgi:hypothetical protein
MSDLISYGVLAGIFVITGLRMFVEKPKKLEETDAKGCESTASDGDF